MFLALSDPNLMTKDYVHHEIIKRRNIYARPMRFEGQSKKKGDIVVVKKSKLEKR